MDIDAYLNAQFTYTGGKDKKRKDSEEDKKDDDEEKKDDDGKKDEKNSSDFELSINASFSLNYTDLTNLTLQTTDIEVSPKTVRPNVLLMTKGILKEAYK